MIFKPNMIVILTKGRLAGKKAVVIKELENNMILVAGINRTPVENAPHLPEWEKRKNAKFLTFIKKANSNHLLATRYKADLGLADLKCDNIFDDIKGKNDAKTQANSLLKSAFDNNKSKWLFTSLKF